MDDDFDGGESEPFSVCSLPLSEPVDTIVLEASSRATDGNTISFNSTQSTDPEYVHSGGKTYLAVDHTANIRKGTAPSWIWDHGSELRLLAGPKPQKNWRCTLCGLIIPVDSTTAHAGAHLRTKHRVYKQGTEPAPRRSIGQAVADMAYHALVSTVQADRFRLLLIRWIVMMHVALTMVEHETFHELVLYICPALDKVLVHTGNTIRRWIIKEFEKRRLKIRNELAEAKSKIHFSFDLWTSPNSLAFCAVVAHFLDKDLRNRSILIGLPRVKGCHSGENIAEAVIPVVRDMIDLAKMGYFCIDNATVNDVVIQIICNRLRPDIPEPRKRRVRCLGHIINLAAMAFLFGCDQESFEAEMPSVGKTDSLEAQLAFWRRKDSKVKLDNLVHFIRKTPQRRQRFSECCMVANATQGDIKGLNVISDNSTRWNSTYNSIARAIDLYTPICMFQIENEQELGADSLSREDWDELKELAAFLKPFKELTVLLQSHAGKGQHGSVWETLPALELLLHHVEQCKARVTDQETSLTISLNNCWQVLRKYYTDDNNYEVYANATLLNPTLRTQYFRDHWDGEIGSYICVMQDACWTHWKQQYSHNHQPRPLLAGKQSIMDDFLARPQKDQSKDEFETYIRQTPCAVDPLIQFDLVEWWWNNRSTFPTLYQDALDMLAIATMSAECDRVFSSAKKMITAERNQLAEDIIQACECLKSWWDNGIIE